MSALSVEQTMVKIVRWTIIDPFSNCPIMPRSTMILSSTHPPPIHVSKFCVED